MSQLPMSRCYIGLGSNQDNPHQQLNDAKKHLHSNQNITLIRCSSIYQSEALTLDDEPQNDYLNAVIEIATSLDADELLKLLQEIETQQGRTREKRWGSRTLDLDIILFSQDKIKTRRLTVPHIEMTKRNFVLMPLAQIADDLYIPGKGVLSQLLDAVSDQKLIKVGEFDV